MAVRTSKATLSAQLKIRVDEELRAALEKSATSKGVSLNSEIATRLSVTFFPDSIALNALASWLGGAEDTIFLLAVAQELRRSGNPPLRELLADPLLCERICSTVTLSTRLATPGSADRFEEAAA